MKNIAKVIFTAVVVFQFASCTVDEGPDIRDAFIGEYSVLEVCDEVDTLIYNVNIVKATNSNDEIFIEGDVYGVGYHPKGIVVGSRLTLPTQALIIREDPDIFYEFAGDGVLSGDVLKIDLDVEYCQEDAFGLDCRSTSCVMTLTKL